MKNYKITDKETKAIIGVVAMTPDQARRAEKDFIVKEAQPKRSSERPPRDGLPVLMMADQKGK